MQEGQRVIASFGKQDQVGVIWACHNQQPDQAIKGLKEIKKIIDPLPIFNKNFREWLEWSARYYLSPLGEVLQTALPSGLFEPISINDLLLRKIRKSPFEKIITSKKDFYLNNSQVEIIEALKITKGFHPALLQGVTGSGKTEIYLELIADQVGKGKEVIVLVPEIGLTPQIMNRFAKRFGDVLGVTHSELTDNQRLHEWLKVFSQKTKVMVGTRSALFAPFQNLGAIIIDEEQDNSYKQEERFRYHARDLAIVRSKMEQGIALLGSATPSLETLYQAKQKKYYHYLLNTRAHGGALPTVHLVDTSIEKKQTQSPLILGQFLRKNLTDILDKKEQAILLLNRRGFSRSAFCLNCKKAIECPHCSVSLTYHRKTKKLECHYCGTFKPLPSTCPTCHTKHLTLLGDGIESLESEIKTYFPKARVARLDRDTTQKKGFFEQTLTAMRNREIDILLGTQMIAKGHDLPGVTLVGVLSADQSLHLPDFRAAEKTFQLITQVAGRAGRNEAGGVVIVQALDTEHWVLKTASTQSIETFANTELKWREAANYPPFARLIQIRFLCLSELTLTKTMGDLAEEINRQKKKWPRGITLLGPSPLPLAKVRDRYRWQILLKGNKAIDLKKVALEIKDYVVKNAPKSLKCQMDVDPLNLL